MTTEFERDLTATRAQLDSAREELVRVASGLADADLKRARRGGWSVRRVLEHVIQSERLYASLVSHLRELPVVSAEVAAGELPSVAEALRSIGACRQALLAALDGVDEESFYRLRTLGREEYSVLSVLENVTNHDREHASQIEAILRAADSGAVSTKEPP